MPQRHHGDSKHTGPHKGHGGAVACRHGYMQTRGAGRPEASMKSIERHCRASPREKVLPTMLSHNRAKINWSTDWAVRAVAKRGGVDTTTLTRQMTMACRKACFGVLSAVSMTPACPDDMQIELLLNFEVHGNMHEATSHSVLTERTCRVRLAATRLRLACNAGWHSAGDCGRNLGPPRASTYRGRAGHRNA
jgi:hypothetical protein